MLSDMLVEILEDLFQEKGMWDVEKEQMTFGEKVKYFVGEYEKKTLR